MDGSTVVELILAEGVGTLQLTGEFIGNGSQRELMGSEAHMEWSSQITYCSTKVGSSHLKGLSHKK